MKQKRSLSLLIIFVIVGSIQVSGIQSSEAQEWFSINLDGGFVPKVEVKNSDADFSYTQFGVSVSTLVAKVNYTLHSYSWEKPETLSLGNGEKAPWEQLHYLSLEGMYGGNITEKWSYMMLASGSGAFEEEIEDAFLDGALISGVSYALSDRWTLLAGGGVHYDDFETQPFPAGGFQWSQSADSGVSLSVIFPVESKISYQTADQFFSASVDFRFDWPPHSANVTCQLDRPLELELGYSRPETTHRLSDDSPVASVGLKKYLETESERVSLGFNYTPFAHLTCYAGAIYDLSRELSIVDKDEDTLQKFEVDESFGGIFSVAYTF